MAGNPPLARRSFPGGGGFGPGRPRRIGAKIILVFVMLYLAARGEGLHRSYR
jgi:hypothetical protein